MKSVEGEMFESPGVGLQREGNFGNMSNVVTRPQRRVGLCRGIHGGG
jgi:hypothetical protein